jgi:hypothetical protein
MAGLPEIYKDERIEGYMEQIANTTGIQTYTIPRGGNRYCGPAVIAYLARTTTNEAADVIARVTGKKKVTGLNDLELIGAMRAVGVTPKWPCDLNFVRLGDLMEAVRDSPDEFVAVVNSRHYVVLHGNLLFDNMNRSGQSFSECTYRNLGVTKAWRIMRQPAVLQ